MIEQHKSEVESLKKLLKPGRHPNIIRYVKDGILTRNTIRYIDMEFCDMNLDEYINGRKGPGGPEIYGLPQWDKQNPNTFLIIAIFQQLLSGVDFIHRKNMVHRDLDPKNGIAPRGLYA
jgi:cyclin-dependent kinase